MKKEELQELRALIVERAESRREPETEAVPVAEPEVEDGLGVAHVLPPDAVAQLREVLLIAAPFSRARSFALDMTVEQIKRKYPQFFR